MKYRETSGQNDFNSFVFFRKGLAKRIHPVHILAISFFILIVLGTGLLLMPWSIKGNHISVLDALFMATSATCVTGLVTLDLARDFTFAGQLTILTLMQLGGLGIMTFSTFFAYILAGRLSMKGRDLIERSVSSMPVPYLGRLLLAMIFGTFFIESVGALLLSWKFSETESLNHAIYMGVFHAISAFCNAGFSLFSSSFVEYRSDWIINLVLIALIVLGGMGFLVLYDMKNLFKRGLSVHSKLVLSLTGWLILGGTVFVAFFEWNNALNKLPICEKLLSSLFQSITCRTAGFNTLDISYMANGTLLIMMILMVVGASPGSCGGGIKTTTFGVIIAMIISRLRDLRQVRLFKRGVPESIISKSIGITFFWLVAIVVATLILLMSEKEANLAQVDRGLFIESIFEAFSAMGTVGLSMGLTHILTTTGKVVIIILMYIGRIGPVTLALAIASKKMPLMRYAEERFLVG